MQHGRNIKYYFGSGDVAIESWRRFFRAILSAFGVRCHVKMAKITILTLINVFFFFVNKRVLTFAATTPKNKPIMKKIQLEPGRKYRGTAWVNEYGEIQFRPEQKGTKPQNMKLVAEHESFSIYESEHLFKVSVKFEKKGFNLLHATNKLLFIISQVKTYLK